MKYHFTLPLLQKTSEIGKKVLDDQENKKKLEADEFTELLFHASQGKSDAQEAICQRYERQVRIVARVLLGPQLRPHLDTTDVLQSVHRSVLVGLREQKFDISSPDKLVALACTMVRRKVARKWRSHRRQERWKNPSSQGEDLYTTLNSLRKSDQDPSQIAAYNDSVENLYKSLSDLERTMLERRLDGFTTGEVAAELGIHPIAIRVRWSRLRQRLENASIFADWV